VLLLLLLLQLLLQLLHRGACGIVLRHRGVAAQVDAFGKANFEESSFSLDKKTNFEETSFSLDRFKG
jgi:hypothetical protein